MPAKVWRPLHGAPPSLTSPPRLGNTSPVVRRWKDTGSSADRTSQSRPFEYRFRLDRCHHPYCEDRKTRESTTGSARRDNGGESNHTRDRETVDAQADQRVPVPLPYTQYYVEEPTHSPALPPRHAYLSSARYHEECRQAVLEPLIVKARALHRGARQAREEEIERLESLLVSVRRNCSAIDEEEREKTRLLLVEERVALERQRRAHQQSWERYVREAALLATELRQLQEHSRKLLSAPIPQVTTATNAAPAARTDASSDGEEGEGESSIDASPVPVYPLSATEISEPLKEDEAVAFAPLSSSSSGSESTLEDSPPPPPAPPRLCSLEVVGSVPPHRTIATGRRTRSGSSNSSLSDTNSTLTDIFPCPDATASSREQTEKPSAYVKNGNIQTAVSARHRVHGGGASSFSEEEEEAEGLAPLKPVPPLFFPPPTRFKHAET